MGYLRVDCRAGVFALLDTLPCSLPCGTDNQDYENLVAVDCPGVGKIARGLRTLLRMIRVGSGAASWATILEQGLALYEVVEMKTSIEGEAPGESGGHQSPPTAGAAWRGAPR